MKRFICFAKRINTDKKNNTKTISINRLASKFAFSLLLFLSVFSPLFSKELPTPSFTVDIPMRDGTTLTTDLYFPPEYPVKDLSLENNSFKTKTTTKLPLVLIRAPSGRHASTALVYLYLPKKGFILAIQETRSSKDKEGKTYPYYSDGWGKQKDGYDTVEWLAKTPFSNGKIGTLGASALGITQLMLAPSNPPSLKCQYINVAASSLYHHAIFPGGQLLKNQIEGWLGLYAKDTSVLSFLCGQPFDNPFWDNFNALKVAHLVKVPAMHIGGWYDTFLMGTIDGFLARQNLGGKGAHGTQKLILGPWTHFYPAQTTLGDFQVPKEGLKPPFDITPERWFDYYLKDIPNKIETLPPVIYYVMGPFDGSSSKGNVWKTAETFPIPHLSCPFYLTKKSEKEGSLTENIKEASSSENMQYCHNPFDPTPTIGGRNLFIESGPKDQTSLEQRKDNLVFTSSPLKEDLEVTGFLKAELFVQLEKEDADIAVRLTDVYPDGKSILISEGLLRVGSLTCVNDALKKQSLEGPIPITIDLAATSTVFAKGHSIRVSITGSNFPKYEKNLNVSFVGEKAGEIDTCNNVKIYVGGSTPSRILLPIIP